MAQRSFRSKQFTIEQEHSALRVSTDSIALGAWTRFSNAERILDVGTGTGILALIAAQRNPTALIDAVEIDRAAAEQARRNIENSPWADRVCIEHSDARMLRPDHRYDLIICNPPYYANELRSADARINLAKHRGGSSFHELVGIVDRLLSEDGAFTCILPLGLVAELIDLSSQAGLHARRRCVLYYVEGRPPKRALLEFGRMPYRTIEEELIVESSPGNYTEAYRALTHDLLLRA